MNASARRQRAAAAIAAIAATLVLGGCGLWRPTPVPLRVVKLEAVCATPAKALLVLLPGSYSLPEDFIDHGFIAALERRHVAATVWLPDAHLGYYSERSILERLRSDVIGPARAAGYRQIWLVGISVGAYGALLHAASSPGEPEVEGIVAIAPYLGGRGVAAAIDGAGGLARWSAPPPLAIEPATEPAAADAALWAWLQMQARQALRPALFLGFGTDDRFAFNERLLAAALPPERVFTAPGGHDWPVWEGLWQRIVEALPLPTDATCSLGSRPQP